MLLLLDKQYCNCRLWICWRLPYSSDQNTKGIFNKSMKTWHSDVINKLVYIVPITRLRSIKYVFPVPSFMTDISAFIFEFRFCLKYYFAHIIKETKILKAYLKEINTNNITNIDTSFKSELKIKVYNKYQKLVRISMARKCNFTSNMLILNTLLIATTNH